MSILQWAYAFKSGVDLAVEFFSIEMLPGTGITFMDCFVWMCVASLLLFFIHRAFG